MKYLLGIDGGTQSTKLTIYDCSGNIVCSAAVKLRPMELGADGLVEHPEDDLWTSLCEASKLLLDKFSGKPEEIVGAGLCSIRFCRALLKKDGTLAQSVMSWMDKRVGLPHTRENPECAYVTTASGYLSARLTGEMKDTAANYLGAWPFDRDTWNWDESAIDAFGAAPDELFTLVKPGDLLGHLTAEAARDTGLPQGMPIFATANDKAVEALGVGCTEEGVSLLSLGTYIAAMTCTEKNQGDTDFGWTNLACIPDRYLFESNGIRRGMWMLSWWAGVLGEDYARRAECEGTLPEGLLNKEAEKVPAGSDGLMVIPHWLADSSHPYRKGMMLGFDGRHGRGHIYRAILEGIALTMRANIEGTGLPVSRFIISGGGSKSDVFMQIFADVLGHPVYRPGSNGSAGLGAAICAAVGLGIWPDFDTAAREMTRVGEQFLPNEKNVAVYEQLFPIYRKLTDFGDELFSQTFPIFG